MVIDMNPILKPNNLTIGEQVVFPLFCNCPGNSYSDRGIKYLVTYVWQPGDDLLSVSNMFQASALDIDVENNNRNFTAAICLPVLIPVNSSPVLQQHFPPCPIGKKSKHHWLLIAILSTVVALLIVLSGVLVYIHLLYKKKRALARNDSSLETSDLIPTKKVSKDEIFEQKAIQDKLLPGVSGYLGKPIIYELHVIMKATMNLNERCRIGGSVYKATINDQKVNHANLVKLMGVSSDNDGNFFIVYEYAENGSLDKWLSPKSLSTSGTGEYLTWSQRLFIALDVANGIQYMHEHTQPSVVHKDIRTSNILLDSTFKAKISNFSTSRPATCSIMLKVDVFSFGVVLLELLSGKKVMEAKDNGEVVMLWKEIRGILKDDDRREERLRRWMDPNLKNSYPIEGASKLGNLGKSMHIR
ncbi:Protein LYK5 [Forsythia ovata]|uniref:Protein LYK5 n=1 Tax=Forsythia ovata TaxID=205694 RepID=A0ABD1UD25_9LAMI